MVLTMNTAAKLMDAQTRVMEGQRLARLLSRARGRGGHRARAYDACFTDRSRRGLALSHTPHASRARDDARARRRRFPGVLSGLAHRRRRSARDNPDNLYHNATIARRPRPTASTVSAAACRTCRSARRRTATRPTARWRRPARSTRRQMHFTADGSFEIIVSRERRPGNWLPMAADTLDAARAPDVSRPAERGAGAGVDRVRRRPGDPAAARRAQARPRRSRSTAAFVHGTARTFVNWVAAVPAAPECLRRPSTRDLLPARRRGSEHPLPARLLDSSARTRRW